MWLALPQCTSWVKSTRCLLCAPAQSYTAPGEHTCDCARLILAWGRCRPCIPFPQAAWLTGCRGKNLLDTCWKWQLGQLLCGQPYNELWLNQGLPLNPNLLLTSQLQLVLGLQHYFQQQTLVCELKTTKKESCNSLISLAVSVHAVGAVLLVSVLHQLGRPLLMWLLPQSPLANLALCLYQNFTASSCSHFGSAPPALATSDTLVQMDRQLVFYVPSPNPVETRSNLHSA